MYKKTWCKCKVVLHNKPVDFLTSSLLTLSSSLKLPNIFQAWKLFAVICCNVWQWWTWMILEKCEPTFSSFSAMPAKIIKKILSWLVLPGGICLRSSSQLYRNILCMGKGIKQWLQHRIALKQQYPCDISPFKGIRDHRRTGIFLPGGAVIHLPKKFLQVAQIFIKQSKGN